MKRQHPMQPLVIDPDGVVRFKVNKIVRYLVDSLPGSMNALSMMPWRREDREQLAQLIGYSVSGFGDLSYARIATTAKADLRAAKLLRRRATRRSADPVATGPGTPTSANKKES